MQPINTPVTLNYAPLEEIIDNLLPNTGTMLCSLRPTGLGHTMVLSRNQDNVPILIDTNGTVYDGLEHIQNYLTSENLTTHFCPVVADSSAVNIVPFGGGFKFIMVNIPKTEDMYAMLGMVADKTFIKLASPKSVPLTLFSIDIESTLKRMNSNKATLIYGDGHTMILLKNANLVLLDPVTNVKRVGHVEIMKYLNTFTKIMALSNPTKSRKKSRKKSRTSK